MNALPPGRPQEPNGLALPVTFFSNFAASRKREEPCTLQTLKTQILSTTATEKSKLPWLKLARFGDIKTDKGSLRHDGNMLAVTGIEADYDGGQMGFDEAVAVLAGAGLSAIVYTSPSHIEDAPRWRVLCACSTEQQPERREHLLGRLNGLFGGVFAGESWARSQSYYYGSVRRNPSHRAEIIDGITIDRCDHLDETWIGKPGPDRSAIIPRSVSETREPVSSKRVDKLITIALNKVQAAAEGQKHATLRSQAIVLGGLQYMGRFTDTEAVGWLMGALPDTVKDWAGAQATATWGLENGRSRPLELEDRPFERAPPPIQKTQAEAAQQGGMPPLDFDNGYFDALAASVDASPTKPARKSKRTAEAHNLDDDRPLISIKAGFIDKLATEAEGVLLASGLPVFQRGSALVRPVTFEVPASRGRTTVSAGLSEMTPAGMIDTYSQIARWERYDKRAEKWLPADPPPLVAAVHLSRIGFWKLPPIAGIITTPTLRPDGTVLLEPGYDRATRLYYVPDPTLVMPTLIAKPSRTDAEAALELLLSLLTGFPFVTDVSKAVALSMLITPVVRGALSVAPLHAAKASTAGTGKSYLVDLASAIATGRACPVAAAATNPEETEKRLVGLLLSAFPIVSLDNVNGELGGDVLCQAVERPLIRVRPLGASKIIEIESRCCIFATGNGLRISGDMVRRSLLAVLDAEMERPELRTFSFDPVSTVLADRGTYVAVCMTIVRAYTVAGSPRRQAALASFEDWSDLVRSALVWLGQADPCRSMEEAREDDPELTDIREMMAGWREAFGILPRPVKKAVEAANATIGQPDEHGDVPAYGATYVLQNPGLRDVLMRLSGGRSIIDGARIGRWLLGHEGRIVGGHRFKRDGTTDGAARWKLQPVMRGGDQVV